MNHLIYLYAHDSGALSKVGLASDGNAHGRKANYVKKHNLTGWSNHPEAFPTGTTTKRELYEVEQAIHDRLRELGGAFMDKGKGGPQEIFAVSADVAREAILYVLDPTGEHEAARKAAKEKRRAAELQTELAELDRIAWKADVLLAEGISDAIMKMFPNARAKMSIAQNKKLVIEEPYYQSGQWAEKVPAGMDYDCLGTLLELEGCLKHAEDVAKEKAVKLVFEQSLFEVIERVVSPATLERIIPHVRIKGTEAEEALLAEAKEREAAEAAEAAETKEREAAEAFRNSDTMRMMTLEKAIWNRFVWGPIEYRKQTSHLLLGTAEYNKFYKEYRARVDQYERIETPIYDAVLERYSPVNFSQAKRAAMGLEATIRTICRLTRNSPEEVRLKFPDDLIKLMEKHMPSEVLAELREVSRDDEDCYVTEECLEEQVPYVLERERKRKLQRTWEQFEM